MPLIVPYRAVAVVTAMVALLGASGLAALLLRVQRRWLKDLLSVLVATVIVGELLFISPAPFPVHRSDLRVPGVYSELAGDGGQYAIIEYPFSFASHLECGRHMYYQMVHGKGLAAALTFMLPFEGSGRPWPTTLANRFLRRLLLEAHPSLHPVLPGSVGPCGPEDFGGVERATKQGFRLVLVHRDLVDARTLAEAESYLTKCAGAVRRQQDGTIDVWQL